MQHLDHYGWQSYFDRVLGALDDEARHETVARIIQEHKEAYLVQTAVGRLWAEISGKLRHTAVVREDFPAVGDWVLLRGLEHVQKQAAGGGSGPVQITHILQRKTVLRRRLEADEQVLCTNVDIAFLATSLNENFNLRRLERYLTLAVETEVQPVILLTKADLCEDVQPFLEEVKTITHGVRGFDVPAHTVSVVSGAGMDEVRAYLKPGVTAVVLGSSGIGKSTLVNYLAEADIQDMMEAREFDDKGRHCTTFRHLVRVKTGGLIIDTPGLRGLTLGEQADAAMSAFHDVETLAATCKFTDCRHDNEPGCAIRAGVESGSIDPARVESYMKLQRELAAYARREDRIAARKQKKLEKRQTQALNKRLDQKWGK